jgi:large subunit ribosomal protein L25
MQELEISAEIRESKGKSYARKMRRAGDVPCILYGTGEDSVPLKVNRRELEKLLSATRSVIIVNYGDTQQRSVVKDIQYHPVKGNIIHVDLQRIKAGQEITLSVPLRFVGNAPGVKMGGVFQELRSELEITCLPKYLPNEIDINISELGIGESIHVSDLQLEHITVEEDVHTAICSVVMPKKMEEITTEEAEEEEEEAEPEVITKSKKEEEEETE